MLSLIRIISMKQIIQGKWCWLFLLIAFGPAAQAALKTLPGHVPAVVARLQPASAASPTNELRLAIGLPLADPAGVQAFLAQVYDPSSPHYRHFLTPAEFSARFGPTEQDYARVQEFARTNGLTILATHANRLLLDVRGPAAAVERAFHVTLRTFRHPTEHRDFFAPLQEPSVDASLPIADISGLENYTRPHPRLHASPAVIPRGGSAPDGTSYFGSDFRNAYVPGTTLDGSGQMVGLLQFEAYYANDVATYATLAGDGRTNILVQPVYLDGASGVPDPTDPNGIAEVSLDIEMAMSMAPGLSGIVVFEGNLTNFIPNDVLNAMAASNTICNLSSSWGWHGGPSATTDSIFQTMAAQGQSFFSASGDRDAFPAGFMDDSSQNTTPSSSPYITQVGGTTLTMNGSGSSYASETVWNWGLERGSDFDGVGSSGGVSSYYAIPTWQQGVNSFAANGGSPTMRNIPDVAMMADWVYVFFDQTNGVVSGTSCAAPLWAGFMALVNQQAATNGQPPVGFINPAVYELANESIYAQVFNDITTGNNTWSSSSNAYYAVPGYDLCTGVGTPAGTNLINALLYPDPLVVVSNAGFRAVAGADKIFNISAQTFFLTNAGTVPLTWSLINTSLWLDVSSSGGTLAAGAGSSVVASLNSAASNLNPGMYSANLWFSNVTSGVGHARSFGLSLSLLQNGGFETGDFTDWTLYGNTVINTFIYNGVENNLFGVVHSGNYGAFLGDNTLAILEQTLPTHPGQTYLLSFWLNNSQGGAGQQFMVNWNTNGAAATNTIFSWPTPPVFSAWSNLNFVVTATGPSTTLQFGAANPPNCFGLDDVSLLVIPPPAFVNGGNGNPGLVFASTNGLGFTWNTLANVPYQVQYKTNLTQAGWLNLGPPITAGSNTLTLVDTNGYQSPQSFYRILVAP